MKGVLVFCVVLFIITLATYISAYEFDPPNMTADEAFALGYAECLDTILKKDKDLYYVRFKTKCSI